MSPLPVCLFLITHCSAAEEHQGLIGSDAGYSKPTNRHPAVPPLHPSMDGEDKLLCLLRNTLQTKKQQLRCNGTLHYTEHRLNSYGQIMWTAMKKSTLLRWLRLCQSLCFTFLILKVQFKISLLRRVAFQPAGGISEGNHRATFSASAAKVQINKSTALREINQRSQQVAAVQSEICIQWHNEEHNLCLAF